MSTWLQGRVSDDRSAYRPIGIGLMLPQVALVGRLLYLDMWLHAFATTFILALSFALPFAFAFAFCP